MIVVATCKLGEQGCWNDGKCRAITKCKNKIITNADYIRTMNDEALAKFLTSINPTNCQDCAFSYGWRCQPDRDDYSDFDKCKEGRKRWLKQPVKEERKGSEENARYI